MFQHIFVFHKESISRIHDFRQKGGHRTNSWSKQQRKNLPKICQKLVVFIYKVQ